MGNGTIHYSSPAYGTNTACGRPIDRVACWDDFDTVTCKRCRAKVEKARADAEVREVAHAFRRKLEDQERDAAATTLVACTARSRRGLVCDLGVHDDDVHSAWDAAANVRQSWIGDKGPAPAGDVLAAVDRVLSAADDHGDQLAPLTRIAARQAELDAELHRTVAELRAAGLSWSLIGGALGVTKQAAAKRFGERRPAPVETGPSLLDALAEVGA